MVDDASTDDSLEISQRKGATTFSLPRQSGPAAARNYGAQKAKGNILFFVDSDVLIRPGTMARIVEDLQTNPHLAAVFGSYDNDPAEPNFISQYKNLYHHFVHQHSNDDAATFWAGCGAVRREVFEAVGGFDPERYPQSSIEDIELGYRMRRAGYRIHLDKDLQAKHLKRWELGSLLRADIFHRAVPWSRLILETRHLLNDFNLHTSARVSGGLSCLALALLPFLPLRPRLFYLVILSLIVLLTLNRTLYVFFIKRKGVGFAARAFPLQWLYYCYSTITFGVCVGLYLFGHRSALAGKQSDTTRQP